MRWLRDRALFLAFVALPPDYQRYGQAQARHTIVVLFGVVGASAAFVVLMVIVHLAT